MIAVFHIWQHRWTAKDEVGLGVTMTGRHHPALEKLIGNFQHSSSVRTNLHGCRTFLDVLGRVKSSFLEVLDLADCACYDHASWADILSDCDPAALPPEVDAYLHRRPKAYLNFEEFDYGGASTAGFKAAGLAATNQVSPVDSDEYETANQTDGPAGGVADFSSVLHPDGTVVTAETVRHRLCLVSALPSWRRHRLCLVSALPSWRRHRLCLVSALPPWLRHHILPFVCTAFVAKTPPLPCVCSAFVAKTPPLPCVCTAFVAKTPPLPCVCSAFVAKTLPFLAAFQAGAVSTTTVVMPGGASTTTVSDAAAGTATTTVIAIDGTTSTVATHTVRNATGNEPSLTAVLHLVAADPPQPMSVLSCGP